MAEALTRSLYFERKKVNFLGFRIRKFDPNASRKQRMYYVIIEITEAEVSQALLAEKNMDIIR